MILKGNDRNKSIIIIEVIRSNDDNTVIAKAHRHNTRLPSENFQFNCNERQYFIIYMYTRHMRINGKKVYGHNSATCGNFFSSVLARQKKKKKMGDKPREERIIYRTSRRAFTDEWVM